MGARQFHDENQGFRLEIEDEQTEKIDNKGEIEENRWAGRLTQWKSATFTR